MYLRSSLFLIFSLFLFSAAVAGQVPEPASTPPPIPVNDPDILKITTTLVQLDVVVTDKKGNRVDSLSPEDFEIYVNGKKQDITNFSFISQQQKNTDLKEVSADRNLKRSVIPPPPSVLKVENARRTYAIVIDDLGLSFESIRPVQQAVRKFINEQMEDGDLVAIVRTGTGVGALQSFTSDKRQLLAAVDKIKWNAYGRGGIGPFKAIEQDIKDAIASASKSGRTVAGASEDKEFAAQVENYRNENFSIGTLGALDYIIRGMRDLPGRKALMLFSEGFQLTSGPTGAPTRVFDTMKIIADLANRASVVVYTLDPRGLQVPGMAFSFDDIPSIVGLDFAPGSGKMDSDLRDKRAADFRDSQQSLRYLAYQTGGFPFVNQNDMSLGMTRALEDQTGYYLIGYQPDSETFDPSKNKFNNVKIKVLRDDLNLRYRSGFYSYADKPAENLKKSPGQQIYGAIVSPFSANDISLSLNTFFTDDTKGKTFIRSLVAIDAKDLKFSKEANGTYKANFDLIAMTFGDNGAPIDEASKNYTITLGEKAYQRALSSGFIYDLSVPIKKPGAYQFRVALRDSVSEKVGSASQFIEVPNLKKNRLALSSIVLDNYSIEQWNKASGKSSETADFDVDIALRRFRTGTVLRYDYLIYNAGSNAGNLEVQARIFKDGEPLVEGETEALDMSGQTDQNRIEAAGAVTLGKNMLPGNYVLQIVVSKKGATKSSEIVSRWTDFEIVN